MATWKQIEMSRERRLWVTQVGIPVLTLGAMYLNNPDAFNNTVDRLKTNAKAAWEKISEKVKRAK